MLARFAAELGGRIHDSLTDPLGAAVTETIAALRRRKDPDELALLDRCMRATDAGHAWARPYASLSRSR